MFKVTFYSVLVRRDVEGRRLKCVLCTQTVRIRSTAAGVLYALMGRDRWILDRGSSERASEQRREKILDANKQTSKSRVGVK